MAVDPNSLTTLAKLETYLGVTAGTDTSLLEASIDAASVEIVLRTSIALLEPNATYLT